MLVGTHYFWLVVTNLNDPLMFDQSILDIQRIIDPLDALIPGARDWLIQYHVVIIEFRLNDK